MKTSKKTLLITRPKHAAERLAHYLQPHHRTIIFPVLDIQPPQDISTIISVMAQEKEYDAFIFVSPTAVEQFSILTHQAIPLHPQIIAMGDGTATYLAEAEIKVDVVPDVASSQGLLDLPGMQVVQQKKIAIFAGEMGNTLLQDTLSARGASITMVYTHRRVLSHYAEPLAWQPEMIDVSIVTSMESLKNFAHLISQYRLQALYDKSILVITPAMVIKAKKIGFRSTTIILVENAYNESIAAALRLKR